jgi:glucose/arabinose dehydrogenase
MMSRHAVVSVLPWLLPTLLLLTACENGSESTSPRGATDPEPTTTPARPASEFADPVNPDDDDPDAPGVSLQEVVTGIDQPVGIIADGAGGGRLFIIERQGSIVIAENGEIAELPFLDIQDRVTSAGAEQGLLGLAFHPDYPNVPDVFINYTDLDGRTNVSRLKTDPEVGLALADTEETILLIEQPTNLHNGGHIAFGPDGYLYIGMGDGGDHGDPFEQAQDIETLLGAIIRIDVRDLESNEPYEIPDDNPFLDDDTVRDEIWAVGLRNPWRFDFDSETGDLYIADVGEAQVEEINFQPADSPGGENYGWPIIEGTECFEADECDMTGLVLPVHDYHHNRACAVIGGIVYRSDALPELSGM